MPRPHSFEYIRSQQIFEELEETPDLSRGEQRLAAEVMLAALDNKPVPPPAVVRARAIALVMAFG